MPAHHNPYYYYDVLLSVVTDEETRMNVQLYKKSLMKAFSILIKKDLDYLLTPGFLNSIIYYYRKEEWDDMFVLLTEEQTRIVSYRDYFFCLSNFPYYYNEENLMNDYERQLVDTFNKYVADAFNNHVFEVVIISEILRVIASYVYVNKLDISAFCDLADKFIDNIGEFEDELILQGLGERRIIPSNELVYQQLYTAKMEYMNLILYIYSKLIDIEKNDSQKQEIR